MKIRAGFVSNSSSSSFVVLKKDLKKENFRPIVYIRENGKTVKIKPKQIIHKIKEVGVKMMKMDFIFEKIIFDYYITYPRDLQTITRCFGIKMDDLINLLDYLCYLCFKKYEDIDFEWYNKVELFSKYKSFEEDYHISSIYLPIIVYKKVREKSFEESIKETNSNIAKVNLFIGEIRDEFSKKKFEDIDFNKLNHYYILLSQSIQKVNIEISDETYNFFKNMIKHDSNYTAIEHLEEGKLYYFEINDWGGDVIQEAMMWDDVKNWGNGKVIEIF